MSKRGENIHKRKDGRWEARILIDDKYKSIYAKSYSEIKSKLRSQLTDKKTQSVIKTSLTVQDICAQWLSEIEIRIKQSTFAKYTHIVNKHIVPVLGGLKLSDIEHTTIQRYINEKIKCGRLDGSGGLSVKSIKDIVSVIKQILKYSMTRGYVKPMDFDLFCMKTQPKELQVLTPNEQTILVKYIKKHISNETIGILLALFTGLRIGELCALQWKDINFEISVITVNKTLQRIQNTDKKSACKTKVVIDTPKSIRSMRFIPIPDFIRDILFSENKAHSQDDYILTGTKAYAEPRTYQYKFKKILQSAGIRDVNFHALRHTFATRAIEHNMDVKSLSEILGHSTVNFTLERYVHSSMELKKVGIDKLAVCY